MAINTKLWCVFHVPARGRKRFCGKCFRTHVVFSQEPHLLKNFPEDFYGQELRLAAVGYLRPEWNFDSLGALIRLKNGALCYIK